MPNRTRKMRATIGSDADRIQNDRYALVRKSNDLIQNFRADMNTPQFKITMYLIAKAYTYEDTLEYVFDIKEFCKCCGLDDDSGGNYDNVRETIKKLRDKSIWYPVYGDPDVEVTLSIIKKAWIYKRSGKIKILLDEDIKPYILDLKKNWELNGVPFTQFPLLYTLPMRGKYSIRLYEILKSWEGAGNHYWKLEEFKNLLGSNYTRDQDFRRFLLEKAQHEINELSDINISFEFKKQRNTKYIYFIIKAKDISARLKVDQTIFDQLNGQMSFTDMGA